MKPSRDFRRFAPGVGLWLCVMLTVGLATTAVAGEPSAPSGPAGGAHDLGALLPLWSVIPFVGMLLSLALAPLLVKSFWARRYPLVALFWAAVFAVPFVTRYGATAGTALAHMALSDYLPFIILLTGLYTVSGGMILRGKLAGTPRTNVVLLLIGACAASVIGTTGAATLMIRPVLRANRHRQHKAHIVVFLIFLVGNIGGVLTPLGDPPLFLGFLHGVPFFWTLRLLPLFLVSVSALLILFYFLDRHWFAREAHGEQVRETGGDAGLDRLRLDGAHNILFLLAIVGAVLISGSVRLGQLDVFGVTLLGRNLLRDGLIIIAAVLSYVLTPHRIHHDNAFVWGPMREVAWLFGGIFVTMIPALAILKAGEHGALAWLLHTVNSPARFFWAAGGLSSFLDNAPTYLTYFDAALGRFYPGQPEAAAVAGLLATHADTLAAISAGAVFMGANTYIGNAPNFMVRSIAEEAGVKMPHFFEYMVKWSIPILLPLFAALTWLFFR
jgi:Na+/H+ antiporter NhaD/arsenite permease-like protein